MYTLISGSPKIRSSSSTHFLQMISQELEHYNFFELRKEKYDSIISGVEKSDTVVFAFPLYVDSPPSMLLDFLDYIIDKNIKLTNKLVYVVVNCGFREGFQNVIAVNILKSWCFKVDAKYMCSIQIGAGEIVGHNEHKLISRTVKRNVQKFAKIVKNKQQAADIITTVDLFNNKLFCYVANIFWNKRAKKNNLLEKDIRIK